ncbi:hypothetical protein [Rhizobium sp. P44RR-XXIV]|uniref:hypothetical protein n=1 Tax=Rhizobium sp. P44RR-XXIV TaxID=1921145 RepID=UPI0009860D99|nr:hypothetical protein [Rhizobium sp. P44RR-XXIV]TIX92789.1 dehydrogenase [Rhizobium sp. P44RR-XXIV]
MNAEATTLTSEPELDPIELILDTHGGDARAAITDLVQRIQHLRYQLTLTSAVMSKGMVRGWEPSLDQT